MPLKKSLMRFPLFLLFCRVRLLLGVGAGLLGLVGLGERQHRRIAIGLGSAARVGPPYDADESEQCDQGRDSVEYGHQGSPAMMSAAASRPATPSPCR